MEPQDIEQVIDFFKELSKIPRASEKESRVCKWLEAFADKHGFDYVEIPVKATTAPNVIISVPPTEDCIQSPTVCLQAHTDMVCQKTPQRKHDFDIDPILLKFEEDWISAQDTTLGADNGIGIAMAMTAALSKRHGPLELLFTVDEEGGLGGATALPGTQLEAKYMLNLDSEDDEFIIGCAGGQRFEINCNCRSEKVSPDAETFEIAISGLTGGHSGVDINKPRLNAIKVCGRLLDAINGKHGLLISNINGGTQTTAIARDIKTVISSPASLEQIKTIAAKLCSVLVNENPDESSLKIEVQPAKAKTVCCGEDCAAIISVINAIDCGPITYCKSYPNIVETSTSVGTISFDANTGKFEIAGAERSSQHAGLELISKKNCQVAQQFGLNYCPSAKYSPWQPNPDSKLLKKCCEVYRELMSKKARVEIVHAGLECGVIGEKYPQMEMVSFGPLIENAHSPRERLSISSTLTCYKLLLGIIEALA